ncbi:AMP-binding protein [Brevibacterium litoralis]|uniref:AMP-binding protein n=1 Tax=Brevibacterium litoralis TaxID=3138935 RepID=UPI0032F06B7D
MSSTTPHISTTLFGRLLRDAEAAPDHPVLVEPVDEGAGGHRIHTRADLLTDAVLLAGLLRDHGVGPGDCVAVWTPSWAEVYAWQYAASALGAHVIGVNTRYGVAEVGNVLVKARPRVLVMAHAFRGVDFLTTARRAVEEATRAHPGEASAPFRTPTVVVTTPPGRRHRAVEALAEHDLGAGAVVTPLVGRDGEWGGQDASAAVRAPADRLRRGSDQGASGAGAAAEAPAEIRATARELRTTGDLDTLAVAFTTSGSTGMPKLAAHSEAAVLRHMDAVAARLGFGDADVLIEPLPYSGVFGYMAGMAALTGGARVVLQPVFDAAALLADWERFGGTHYIGGDDMISRFRAEWEKARAAGAPIDLATWRWSGVADFQGMSAELARWAAAEFGTVTSGLYGSSEVFSALTSWADEVPEDLRLRGGGALVDSGYEYRVVDPGDESPVSAGERGEPGVRGELQLRGTNVVDAYLGDADGSVMRKNVTDDGWFRTGDLAAAIDARSFAFVCRMGDVIRLKGFLVDPAEIEMHLASHPGVAIAKVVGRTGVTGEPEVVAFVQVTEGADGEGASGAGAPTGEDLREYCRDRLARFKVPAEVRIVEAMPTTAGTNGTKIKAAVLREWAAL